MEIFGTFQLRYCTLLSVSSSRSSARKPSLEIFQGYVFWGMGLPVEDVA